MSDRTDALDGVVDYLMPEIRRALEQATQTCIICEHFDEVREICFLAGKHPPARVIAYGCEKFKEGIPF